VAKLVTQPMASWFVKIALSVEKLEFSWVGQETGLLSQLLAMAAIAAPNLRELSICQDWRLGAVLDSVAFLSQIKRLRISRFWMWESENWAAVQRLSGLRSLQVAPLSHWQIANPKAT